MMKKQNHQNVPERTKTNNFRALDSEEYLRNLDKEYAQIKKQVLSKYDERLSNANFFKRFIYKLIVVFEVNRKLRKNHSLEILRWKK
jgi:hypothetical protein